MVNTILKRTPTYSEIMAKANPYKTSTGYSGSGSPSASGYQNYTKSNPVAPTSSAPTTYPMHNVNPVLDVAKAGAQAYLKYGEDLSHTNPQTGLVNPNETYFGSAAGALSGGIGKVVEQAAGNVAKNFASKEGQAAYNLLQKNAPDIMANNDMAASFQAAKTGANDLILTVQRDAEKGATAVSKSLSEITNKVSNGWADDWSATNAMKVAPNSLRYDYGQTWLQKAVSTYKYPLIGVSILGGLLLQAYNQYTMGVNMAQNSGSDMIQGLTIQMNSAYSKGDKTTGDAIFEMMNESYKDIDGVKNFAPFKWQSNEFNKAKKGMEASQLIKDESDADAKAKADYELTPHDPLKDYKGNPDYAAIEAKKEKDKQEERDYFEFQYENRREQNKKDQEEADKKYKKAQEDNRLEEAKYYEGVRQQKIQDSENERIANEAYWAKINKQKAKSTRGKLGFGILGG
jgi:hypothetical protein